jgi:hypothetical protein
VTKDGWLGLGVIVLAVACVGAVIGVAYVIVHFVIKFW